MFDKIRNLFFIASPALLIYRIFSYLFNYLKKITKKDKKSVFNKPETEYIISAVKETKSSNETNSSFLSDFKYPKENHKMVSEIPSKKPMEINVYTKELLKNSIIISPYDVVDDRKDLEFIGNSRISGRGIYRYIGNDFSKFDLPYEEIPLLYSTIPTYNNDYDYYRDPYSDIFE